MKGELLVYQSFIHGVNAPCINEYQLRLDVQRFLWPAYYLFILCILGFNFFSLVSFPDPPPNRKGGSGTSSHYGLAVAIDSAKS